MLIQVHLAHSNLTFFHCAGNADIEAVPASQHMTLTEGAFGIQRNGPAACYHLLSALERRRQEQEDAGLKPTPLAKSLYKVTNIKRILASIVNECRAARNQVPSKNSSISWDQVITMSVA